MGLSLTATREWPVRTAFTARGLKPRREPPALMRSGSTNTPFAFTDNWWDSPSLTGVNINQQTALQVSAVMACVGIISEDVSKLQPALYRKRADGGKDPVKNHPLVPLLTRPNDWQTWFEFCQMQIAALLLRGNAYTVLLRNRGGDPVMFVPINPDRVTLWEAPTGDLFFVVTRTGLHELAVLKNVPLFVPYDDVMHWKGLSGTGLLGVSKIAMCREAIGLAAAMEQLASRTIGNGAKPSGYFVADKKITDEVGAQLKSMFQQRNAGLENAGKVLVMEKGLEWKPISLTFADLQFIANRNYQNVDIARIFRVPAYMIGEDSKISRANQTQMAQDYLNNTLMTYVDIIEQRFAFTFGLDEDGLFVSLDLAKILRADLAARYAAYRIGQMGWLTINEIRIAEGLNPIGPEGDVVMRPVNMAPANSDVFLGQDLPDGQPDDPNGPGSDVTGDGGEGGGRPPEDGTDPAPSD